MSDGGIRVRPADTLLVERALDYLAAGPADAMSLVARVCQIPTVSRAAAEQMAEALLAGRPEFARQPDGRWALAPRPPRGGEAGAPRAASRAVPTFDEWLAQRRAEQASRAADGHGAAVGGRDARRAESGDVPNVDGSDAAPRPRRARALRRPPDEVGAAGASTGPAGDDPCDDRAPIGPAGAVGAAGGIAGPDDDVLSTLSYVVVDVETTGGRPYAGDRVTEIAAVTVRDGRIHDVYETLINPQRSIPPMITAITNITWEMVRDQPTFGDICPNVLSALRGHVFVAHNATFDWKFVTSEVRRATGEELDGRRLCTVRLARRLLPQLPRRSLDWVARHYGVSIAPEARHRAAGDAVATAHVLLGLLRDAADRGLTTWRHLDEFLSAPRPRRSRRRSAMPGPIDKDTTA
jgi:DNA polymerase III subunit epsilon